MATKLVLVPEALVSKSLQPALMREKAAAKYLGIGLPHFRELVRLKVIDPRQHQGGTHRVYLREDLDRYARTLEVIAV